MPNTRMLLVQHSPDDNGAQVASVVVSSIVSRTGDDGSIAYMSITSSSMTLLLVMLLLCKGSWEVVDCRNSSSLQ